jgi:hypothetical protein
LPEPGAEAIDELEPPGLGCAPAGAADPTTVAPALMAAAVKTAAILVNFRMA